MVRQTVATPAAVSGPGLHSGQPCTARLLPAPAGSGIVFRRTDQPAEIRATVDAVRDADRRTVLANGTVSVQTVEHVLAAVSAAEVDDLTVELDADEPPAGDGSARPYQEAIARAGVARGEGTPTTLTPARPFQVRAGEATYLVAPHTGLRLTVTIDWPHPLIGRQAGSWDVTPERFAADLAGARTFGFKKDRDDLAARGLALGASAENTIILTDDGLDGGALRWPDEFVRHKAVDLLGDLALTGARLRADIVAHRPSHAGNVALARALRHHAPATGKAAMDIQDILKVLPHRYPMLLVDRILEVEGRERIVGIKNVTINEPFFQGHFPGHPVMPGVLIVEAMAQCGGMLLMGAVDDPETKVVYFMAIDGVKFRRPVVPGDQLRFELEMLKFRGKTCRMKGVALVDGQVAAEAEMMAAIVDK